MPENFDIGWIQAGSVIISVLISLITAIYIFYKLTSNEINVIRDQFNKMDERWESRFGKLEDRVIKVEEKWESRFSKMEEKWEKLFERLYFKDNPSKKRIK